MNQPTNIHNITDDEWAEILHGYSEPQWRSDDGHGDLMTEAELKTEFIAALDAGEGWAEAEAETILEEREEDGD